MDNLMFVLLILIIVRISTVKILNCKTSFVS